MVNLRVILFFVSNLASFALTTSLAAAPHGLRPNLDPESTSASGQNAEARPKLQVQESLIVAPPPSIEKARQERGDQYYFPYKKSMSPHFSLVVDSSLQVTTALGISYQLPSDSGRHWEVSTLVESNGGGDFLFLYKRIFQKNQRVRPYYSLGLDLHPTAQEGLTTFFNPRNWGLAGFIGVEDLLRSPMSWRIDLGAKAHRDRAALIFRLGYSWSW